MRRSAWVLLAVVLGAAVGCGGSTEEDPKGAGGGGGAGGTKGGAGGSGAGGSGGSGASPVDGGASGGPGCDPGGCGPSGAPCCSAGDACGGGTAGGGSFSCTCTGALVWECGGGSGGSGGLGGSGGGGSGGTGGCDPGACGPHGAKCCQPNSGCGTASGGGPSISCNCTSAGIWDCQGGFGGGGGGAGGGGGSCSGPAGCAAGTTCCAGKCVNTANDPFNCGGCGNVCAASPPYCSGICGAPPCFAPGPPPPGTFCCGASACQKGQLCCDVNGPGPSGGPTCFWPTPQQPTCPIGCPLCQ